MARYGILSAVLLIWGCSTPKPPASPNLHLKAAHVEQGTAAGNPQEIPTSPDTCDLPEER